MTLEDLGYYHDLEQYRQENGLGDFAIGRVIAEHKERYVVKTPDKEFDAEITGNLRFSALNRSDFPAVGDWVAFTPFDDHKGLIHAVLPRKSTLERKAVAKSSDKQLIATNIDGAFIVQAVDRDFNINRIERYLTICYTTNVTPIILLTKIDLMADADLATMVSAIQTRLPEVPLLAVSNTSKKGLEQLNLFLKKGKTYCLLGSSGVGKSSLLNNLLGEAYMLTNEISVSSNRGKHVTTHRELCLLENGSLLIDNPGMREVGIADFGDGLDVTFDTILELAKACKFKNCTHTSEPGCAVLAALEKGTIQSAVYNNFLKMEKEKDHYEMTLMDRRKRDRAFGKIMKNYKKIIGS